MRLSTYMSLAEATKVLAEEEPKLQNGRVSLTKEEFVKEHKRLPRVLRKGTQKEQEDEASEQQQELQKLMEKVGR